MLAYGDRMRRRAVELDDLASYWIERIATLLDACVRDRNLLPGDRTVDVHFDEFMADDIAMVERVFTRNDHPMTPDARHQLDTYLEGHRRGRHGRIDYDLRRDFGLEPRTVRERFSGYTKRFHVAIENVSAGMA
jgi:hypothetical protein